MALQLRLHHLPLPEAIEAGAVALIPQAQHAAATTLGAAACLSLAGLSLAGLGLADSLQEPIGEGHRDSPPGDIGVNRQCGALWPT